MDKNARYSRTHCIYNSSANHYSGKQSPAILLSFSKIACTKSIFHPSFHPMTMTKRPFKCCTYIFFPISIFFCIYISFSEKGADQVRLMYHRFCYSGVLHVKWESLSAFFGSKIFHHHRYFDTVHCSNLDIKMLKICCVFPEIWEYMDNFKCKIQVKISRNPIK